MYWLLKVNIFYQNYLNLHSKAFNLNKFTKKISSIVYNYRFYHSKNVIIYNEKYITLNYIFWMQKNKRIYKISNP